VNQIGLSRATALAIAATHAPRDELEALSNVPGINGSTALKCAVVHGQVEAVKLLLDHRADISTADENGYTPIMQSSLGQFTAVTDLLLSAGASQWDLMRDGFPRQVRQLGFRRILRAGGSLRELPESLGECKQLVTLNINGCVDLRRLPDSVGECEALRELTCRGCVALSALPETLGRLENLEILDVTRCTALTSLPTTLRHCMALRSVDVTGCEALNGILDEEFLRMVRARGEAGSTS